MNFWGRPFVVPRAVDAALAGLFGESVAAVRVFEQSNYAGWHGGAVATTRPERIFVTGCGTAFVGNAELLLHEYFHVIRQWRPRRMSRIGYLGESLRRGYWQNRFEVEARQFAAGEITRYRGLLSDADRSVGY